MSHFTFLVYFSSWWADSQKVLNVPSIPKQTLQMFLKYTVFFAQILVIFYITYDVKCPKFEEILSSAMKFWESFDKIGKIKCDFDRMFLNLDDLGNVPQYPGYPGYQLFATLGTQARLDQLQLWIEDIYFSALKLRNTSKLYFAEHAFSGFFHKVLKKLSK